MTTFTETTSAIRGKREGADNWTLADALLAAVPQHAPRTLFAEVRRAAEREGVRPYGADTLRIYRDAAARWAPADRIPGVSFTAHREALLASDPVATLRDLADTLGAENVAVSDVRAAISALAPSAPAVPAAPVGATLAEVGADTLAQELANRYRDDKNATVHAVASAPAAIALLADLIAATEKRANARQRKSDAWKGPKSSATPSAPSAPDAKRIIGNVRG